MNAPNATKLETVRKIVNFENQLQITFPRSYRDFLLKHGSALIEGYTILGIPEHGETEEKTEEKEEEKEGTILFFRHGDLSRGKFAWISNYQGRIVGLCNLPNCRYCNLAEREQKLVPVCFATDFFDKMQYSCNI